MKSSEPFQPFVARLVPDSVCEISTGFGQGRRFSQLLWDL